MLKRIINTKTGVFSNFMTYKYKNLPPPPPPPKSTIITQNYVIKDYQTPLLKSGSSYARKTKNISFGSLWPAIVGLILYLASGTAAAQFVFKPDSPNPLPSITDDFAGVSSGSIAFADVDGDNDQDVIITGYDGSNRIAKLYINDGAGNFTEKTAGTLFTGVSDGSIAFADVDGDNDQDVIITGGARDDDNNFILIAKLYTNDGSGNFNEKVGFSGVTSSSIAFADVDGDNDQDVLITGNDGSNRIARLYTNDGAGNFTEETGTPFTGVSRGSIAFADVDADNDQDVIVTGNAGTFRNPDLIATLYTNDGSGNFTEETETPFTGVQYSSIAFADVDADNDQDVLITGVRTSSSTIAQLYTNDGRGNFTRKFSGASFTGVAGSIAFADVDGDNDQDVLITGNTSNRPFQITKLYTNDGSGNFNEKINFAGISGSSIAFADVDGDDDLDMLITGVDNNRDEIARLYTNDGSGNFNEKVGFSGVTSSSIAFADVDGDNDLDMLITGADNNRNEIAKLYTNDGSGNFSERLGTPFEGVDEGSIAFADVDGDNDQDVIITGERENGFGRVIAKLYTNDGSGNFIEKTTGTPFTGVDGSSIAFADVNGDGDQDVLITGTVYGFSTGNGSASLYVNNGSGTFIRKTSGTPFEGVSDGSIAFADVDGDNDQDVLITGRGGGRIAKLYTNNGSGNFTEKTAGTPFEGVRDSSIAFADVDGDNDQDVFITGRSNFTLLGDIAYLYTNDGKGNFTRKTTGIPFTGVNHSSIAFADVDGDDDQDVLITGSDSDSNDISKLYTNDGKGNFTEKTGTPFTGVSFSSIAFADVDGDNDRDVLITGSGIVRLYTNDSKGNFSQAFPLSKIETPPFAGVSGGAIAFADVDNDNDNDVIIAGRDNSSNDTTILYTNDGSGSFTKQAGTPFLGVRDGSVTFIDMDGDSDSDVLITRGSTARLYVNDGSGSFTEQTGAPFAGEETVSSVAFSDVDGDDDVDVLLLESSSTAKFYLNNGSNSFTETTPFGGVATVTFTTFADVDNDGDPDVLIRGMDGEGFSAAKRYTNDGSGTFTEEAQAPTADMFLIPFALIDVDGDGDNDVIDDTDRDTRYEVLINDGSNNFTEKTTGVPFASVRVQNGSIAFPDADGDGDSDVLITGDAGTFRNADPIAKLYLNDGSGNFTEQAEMPYVNVFEGSIAFADVDGDNDDDVLITGLNNPSNPTATALLYINEKIPVFTSGSTTEIEVLENTTDVLAVSATDADSEMITYTISAGTDSASFNLVGATGVLTFKTAPDRESPADQDDNNIYSVVVTASDGENEVPQVITVTVTDVNDNDPVITSDASINVAENIAATILTVTATDADAGAVIRYSVSGGADRALFAIGETSGALMFITAPDFEGASTDGDDAYEVIVTASDGTNSDTQTITVTVTDVNDNTPVITSDASIDVAENTAATGLTVTATDADASAVITYSVTGGADGALFAIDANSGVLTFTTAPDFEGASADGDDDYEVIVTASDGDNSVIQTITVTVTDVNDNDPVITSDASISVAENIAATGLTVTATDADAGAVITYSVTGGADEALFTIEETSGALNFIIAPDFEGASADGDDAYEVIVTASDGDNSVTQTITVTVTDVNDNTPVIASDAAINVAENTAATGLTVTATDADASAVIRYAISGGADRGLFIIGETSGVLTFINAPDFEGASADGDDAYEVIVTASDGENSVMQTITVTVTDVNEVPEITSPATATIVENTTDVLTVMANDPDAGAVIRYSISGGADVALFAIGETSGALTFTTAPDFEGSSADGDDAYEVIVTASDGDNSVMQTITVTVTDMNDNTPVITSDASINVAENIAATGLTVTATDADASAVIRYSISGGADRALFTIGETSGVLTFITAPDFEGSSADGDDAYEVIVTASDGDNNVMQTITVTVTDVNEIPEITSLATATIAENTTDVLNVMANDPDAGAVIRYSISGGADGALFAIGETSGALTFITAPDFEGSSADGDDDYEVEVTVSDGTNSVTQIITITVTNDPADDILGLPEAEGVRLYPNPASGHFKLTGTSGRLSRVSLVSTAGKEVRSYPSSQDGVYYTSGLGEGIFFVIIEGTEGRQQAGRIVIRE